MGKCILAAVFVLMACGGCTLCPSCDLEDYGTYGGRWQRTNPSRGRVGSVFAPAGALVPYAEESTETDEGTNDAEADAADSDDVDEPQEPGAQERDEPSSESDPDEAVIQTPALTPPAADQSVLEQTSLQY